MTIQEERDVVLYKIYASSHRDQAVSYTLLLKEIQAEFGFNIEKVSSLVWYLKDHRYITREGEKGDLVKLTSKGFNLISEGGFVTQQSNRKNDLQEKIKSLNQSIGILERKVRVLEEKGHKFPRLTKRNNNSWMVWLSFLFAILALALSSLDFIDQMLN